MNTEKIDVLEVMERAANILDVDGNPSTSRELEKARALVAELIAADKAYDTVKAEGPVRRKHVAHITPLEIAAERRARAIARLTQPAPFRNLPDGATFEDYRDQLAVGDLTPVDQMAFDNLLHDELERLTQPAGDFEGAELPELPEPSQRECMAGVDGMESWPAMPDYYTAEQMREYARAARRARGESHV